MKPWSETTVPLGWECRSTPRIDLLAGAEQAVGLLVGLLDSEPQDPCAQNVFMREIATSQLSHFGWFYLLACLLSLRQTNPEDVMPHQAAFGENSQA